MRGRAARALASAAAVPLAIAPMGCPPQSSSPDQVVAANPSEAIELDEDALRMAAAAELAPLVAAHNERARKLETLESRASVEIRSRDADGDHFDQCEGDIFLAPGGKGALRLTKLGSNLAWIGSDGTRGWVFRLDAQPTQATVFANARVGAFGSDDAIASEGGFRLLTPDAVRALAALAPVPGRFEELQGAVRDPAAGALVLEAVADAPIGAPVRERFAVSWRLAGGSRLSMRFGPDGKPAQVVARDASGRELLRSSLAEFVRAQAENLAIGAWPELARRIEITTPAADASVRIYLGEPIATARRMKPRFFDLDALIAQLRPDSVEYLESPVVDPRENPTGRPVDGFSKAPSGPASEEGRP